jgi:hypothetical protein
METMDVSFFGVVPLTIYQLDRVKKDWQILALSQILSNVYYTLFELLRILLLLEMIISLCNHFSLYLCDFVVCLSIYSVM